MKTLLVILVIFLPFHLTHTAPDNNVEKFMDYAVQLLKEDLRQTSARTMKKRSTNSDNPGYYAMPLPPLPTDVRHNLSGMKLATNVNMDLVRFRFAMCDEFILSFDSGGPGQLPVWIRRSSQSSG